MRKVFSLALACMVLTGCATARMAEGPGVNRIIARSGNPMVEVSVVKDGRGKKTHAGTIGAAGISVPTEVTKTLHNYLVNTLYDNFAVNVKSVEEGATKPAIGSASLVTSTLESVSIYSIDAILQPVDTRCVLQLTVRDASGGAVYEKTYNGFYQERIGMAWDTNAVTGNLVEEAIRDMMKQIAADEKLKNTLEAHKP